MHDSPHPQPTLDSAQLERRILFEADGMIAVDKPWGLPTTGRKLDDPDCLQYALMQRQGSMTWAVHQLDADTSGVNLFVCEKDLVAHWKERLRSPNGVKTYLAIAHGEVTFDERRIEAPIGMLRESPSPELGVVADGKHAVTVVRVLARKDRASLLRVRIETGRTHQIRIHLASIGHPLFGEDWYREPKCTAHPRQALHAWRVEFRDAEEPASIESPIPDDLRSLISELRLELPPAAPR